MRYIVVLIAALLSGCVIDQTQYHVSYTEISSDVSEVRNVTTKTIRKAPVKLAAPATVVEQRTKIVCAPFIMPDASPMPSTPVFFNDPEMQSKTDADVILTDHIKKLKGYNLSERKRMRDVYERWFKDCR